MVRARREVREMLTNFINQATAKRLKPQKKQTTIFLAENDLNLE